MDFTVNAVSTKSFNDNTVVLASVIAVVVVSMLLLLIAILLIIYLFIKGMQYILSFHSHNFTFFHVCTGYCQCKKALSPK